MILCIGCYCIWQTKTTAMMPQLHSQKHILTFNQLGPKKRPYRRFYAHNHPYTYLLLVTTGCQHVRNPMLLYSCQPEAMHPPLWAIQLNIGEVWSRTPSSCIFRYVGTNSSILIVCDSHDFDILNAAKKVVADKVQIFALIAAACREPQQHRAPEETCSSKMIASRQGFSCCLFMAGCGTVMGCSWWTFRSTRQKWMVVSAGSWKHRLNGQKRLWRWSARWDSFQLQFHWTRLSIQAGSGCGWRWERRLDWMDVHLTQCCLRHSLVVAGRRCLCQWRQLEIGLDPCWR